MGDSILDTGNNNYIVTMSKFNFPPYGKNFPGKIPTGRPSDGRLISDFVVEILGIKYLLPSYLDPNLGVEDLVTGVCFASAGSVSQASATLRQLYGLGVRNIVHLSTIVTGCVPASRTLFGGVRRQCNDESNELAMMYNKKLSNEIERLNNDVRLPNSSIVFVDVYYPLFNMIRYPENYGFAITKKACCGTGTVEFGILCNPLAPTCTNISKYIFWDGVHPTEKTYKIIFSKIGKSVDKLLRKQL
ncbi:unnamed protein product [Linum tenue]|uniref:Uncharacterized protein n=1 Tax=Linum tenue TaxID=586396 RepID=A0AAV0QVG1_9ROSI|nr:unnamed protein product [Linum tenue]